MRWLVMLACIYSVALTSAALADWPMWGGSPNRNMVQRAARDLPVEWDIDNKTHLKWSAKVGSVCYGNPALADGKIVLGTNNDAPRDPAATGDRGVVMCFAADSGAFLWQDTYEKLAAGQAQDWPLQGICSSPAIAGQRVYYLTNRGQVVCADLDGFHDGENDGPEQTEAGADQHAADIVWRYDLMAQLGVVPRFMAASNPLVENGRLYVVTSNGVDPNSGQIANASAPSFVCLDSASGRLVWQQGFGQAKPQGVEMAPLMEGQWGSVALTDALADGKRQLLAPGGDGFLYALAPDSGALLWKQDCNPPGAKWRPGGGGDKCYLVATPVYAEGRVFVATGQDPEHGGGPGNLLAIDPSPQTTSENRVLWRLGDKAFGRSISTVAVQAGVVYAAELDGFLHAIDAATGKELWQHDMLSQVWGSPLLADGKLYLGDEDGDVLVAAPGRELKVLAENRLPDAIYGTPIAVGRTLYLATRGELYALEAPQPSAKE